jgi:hypothetical protein
LKLTTFEKYVLGVCHDIDELIYPNKAEVVERFEEFAARNFEGLCEKHANPGPVIADLCGERKKLGDKLMKTEYKRKETEYKRKERKRFQDLELQYDRTASDYEARIRDLSQRDDFNFLIGNLNLLTAPKRFEAYLLNRRENQGKHLSEMVWYGASCCECKIRDIPRAIWILESERVGFAYCDNCFRKRGGGLVRGGRTAFRVPPIPNGLSFLVD